MSTYEVDSEDIEFRTDHATPLLARLYRPRGPGPFPAVVEVHGGAWTMNDRTTNVAIDTALAASGVLVMAIDFRMPPVAQYPAAIADVNFAVRWLKANAGTLGADPGLIGGVGTSSGGQLMALAALRPHDPRHIDGTPPALSGHDATLGFVVLCWPIVDPLARYRMAKARGLDRIVRAHDAFWPSEAAMSEGNPQLILERGEPAELPPALVIQGTNDDNVTPDMADKFAAAYAERGGSLQLRKFEGEPHTFVTRDPSSPASVAALEEIKAFVRAQTGHASASAALSARSGL